MEVWHTIQVLRRQGKPKKAIARELGISKNTVKRYWSPDFPKRFGSIEEARAFYQSFFSRCNQEHYHTGIGLLTPHVVHYGLAEKVIETRRNVLSEAYRLRPEPFVNGPPRVNPLPNGVWINPPPPGKTDDSRSSQEPKPSTA